MPTSVKQTTTKLTAAALSAELHRHADEKQAVVLSRFFKTKEGSYGAGDHFLGIKVPVTRKIISAYREMPESEVEKLLNSKYHEERLASALLLVHKYVKGDDGEKEYIYHFYMGNAERFNNWDLVDLSAPQIAGHFLFEKERTILFDFARSDNLWKKRIAMVSTHGFIRRGDISSTYLIADILMQDTHDLIHKAVGWMLREAGKIDEKELKRYLHDRYKSMPRTMLRYAIEKFAPEERKSYLNGSA